MRAIGTQYMEADFCGEWGQKMLSSTTDPFVLLHQFLFVPNLLLPFLSPILACFVWLDCLVVRDYLFLGMYSS